MHYILDDTEGSETDGQSVIYAIHSKTNDDADVAVTKYFWDKQSMKYLQCKPTSRRALSAPVSTPDTSSYLQKLFRAARESNPQNAYSKNNTRG